MIKRENWNGHYKIVQRDRKGKILSHQKWTKDNDMEQASRTAKKSGTINPNVEAFQLTNVVEIVEKGRNARKPISFEYQVWIKIKIGKRIAEARSRQQPASYPKKLQREEALSNALAVGVDYNEDQYSRKDFKIIDEGVIYYKAIA